MPQESTGTIAGHGGMNLFYRQWHPQTQPRGAVLVIHGLGEHSGRYRHLGERLAAQGLMVRAYDQRGHGRSPGRRGDLTGHDDLLQDAQCMLASFSDETRSAPFLLGHSLGGLVAARFATAALGDIRGLVLSSPALKINLSRGENFLRAALSRLAPGLTVSTGLPGDYLSHEADVVRAYRADPLVHNRISSRMLNFMLDASAQAHERATLLAVPALVMAAAEDKLVDPQGSRDFFQRLPAARREFRWYEGYYHEIFNETGRETVFGDLQRWLESRLAAAS